MTGTILSLFLIVTVVSEIFLLNQNFSLKKRISAYHHLEGLLEQLKTRQDKTDYERSFEGQCLPFFSHQQLYAETNEISEISNSRFVVMFYFSIHDCGSCLTDQIVIWNEFADLYKRNICKVIGITDTTGMGNLTRIRGSLNIEFPVFQIPDLQSNLAEHGIRSTPAVLFGDVGTKRILYAHFPTIEDHTRKAFTNKLQILLNACGH